MSSNKTSIIIFDLKGDYKDLPQQFGKDWHLFSWDKNLRVGLNGPASVPPHIWIGALTTCIAARLGLIVSRTCLAGIILLLLKIFNAVFQKPNLVWPSIKNVLEATSIKGLAESVTSKPDYLKTLIQKLEGLIYDSNNIFDCSRGIDLNDIIDRGQSAVIDISNLSPSLRNLIVDILLEQVLTKAVYNHDKCDRTRVMFVIDEADLLVSEDNEESFEDQLSTLSKVARMGREYGLQITVGISTPTHLVNYLYSSSFYTLAFCSIDPDSVFKISKSLFIKGSERLISNLPKGQCVFRQAENWSQAFLAQIDYIAPGRKLKNLNYPKWPYIQTKSIHDIEPVINLVNQYIMHMKRVKGNQDRQQKGLSENSKKLLALAYDNPYTPVARLFDKMKKVSFSVQKAVREEIEKHELAKFEEVRIGRKNVLLIEITDTGYEYLDREPPKQKGRGELVHRHFSHWIRILHNQKGQKAWIEWQVPNTKHPVDAAALNENGKYDLYEVSITATENLIPHIKKCFTNPDIVNSLTIVTALKSKTKKLEKEILSELALTPYIEKVKFEVIDTYLKEIKF